MIGIKKLGEFGLIELICKETISDPASVVVGIGDDAAAFVPGRGMLQLVSTDMLVEGVHFDLSFTTAFQLGYKSLAVNLSDIAAMGGVPKQAVVAIAIPAKLDAEYIMEFYRGMKKIARDFNVNIIGGDTVSSPSGLTINVTVLGEVLPEKLIKRSGAREGDLVVVTGSVGNSAAGLACLQQGKIGFDFSAALIQDHLTPCPQVAIAPYLASYASSMNDISDGLASESMEIATASHAGLRLWADKIPFSAELKAAADMLERPALDFALYGGEDYQLLFTVAQKRVEELCKTQLPNRLTVIGVVTDMAKSVELVMPDGRIVKLEAKGYNHFIES